MKLLKLNTDHYIVVDNSLDFSETDYYWDDKQKEIRTGSNNHVTGGYKIKITHSTQPLECDKMWTPVNGKQWMCNTMLCCGKILNLKTKPISLQEIKELIGEVNVENRAESRFGTDIGSIRGSKEYDLNTDLKRGFVSGYNQALEDNNEKKYTEEDMRKAWNAAYIDAMSIDEETYKPLFFDDFIQSLHPKTEWEVEFINGKLTLKQ